MKRLAVGLLALAALGSALGLSLSGSRSEHPGLTSDLRVTPGDRNPWTNLRLNNDPSQFQFAVVTDRAGGPRAGVFERAVESINALQPEFVLSVGDLIQGSSDADALTKQWAEFDSFVARLEVPFFYTPGNHDVGTKAAGQRWVEKFGRRYFHFSYKGVLFVVLDTEETIEKSTGIGPEQLAWLRQTLADNRDARWTVVCMHKPLWTTGDLARSGWADAEDALAGRSYTVFAGHKHRYEKFERNGQRYYMLATTGGASKLRGLPYGEFDQIVWVTMKKEGPRLANLMLEGVYTDEIDTTLRAKSGATSGR
jgi:hypothetical protein